MLFKVVTLRIFLCDDFSFFLLGLVVTAIKNAYAEELKVKKCIAEKVAHSPDRETINFHKIAWVYQIHLTPSIKMKLESLLVETGQR